MQTPTAPGTFSRGSTPNQPETGDRPSLRNLPLLPLLTTLSASILLLLAGGFALTRPCVLGGCDRLTQAETETEDALNALSQTPTTDNFIAASQTLARSQEVLEPIPIWSLYHDEASSLEDRLDRRSQQLGQFSEPLRLGLEAAQMSQSPPHRLEEWRQMERLWEQAIAQLEIIDPENAAYGFARTKLKEYRQNLAAVRQRATLERRGDEQLEAARLAADVARSRQTNARDLETWQQTYASWRTAVRALMRVPTRTTAYATARQLFQAYRPQLSTAQERQTQEQLAQNLHDRALKFADEAKTAQDRGQWQVAVGKWRQALGYAQQIPADTAYAEQSAPLVRAYTNALVQAIARQELAETLQRAKGDLERLCNGSPKICQYQVTSQQIIVKLLPDYVSRVQTLDRQAQQQSNTAAQTQLNQHVRGLIDGLELVSLNSGIPLKVLNPNGEEVGSFKPTE